MEDAEDAVSMIEPDVDSPENQPLISPVAKELLYNYDFGDNWHVKITGSWNCLDLVESGRITQGELDEATKQVLKSYRPVMIARDGHDVLDDVGGLSGFASFLRGINGISNGEEAFDYGNKKESLEWAKSLGWSTRKIALKNRL